MPEVADHDFLRELIAQTDQRTTDDVSASEVLATLGAPDSDPEPIVVRLCRRGLIEVNPNVALRHGDGWWEALIVTPAGYRHDDTGLSR